MVYYIKRFVYWMIHNPRIVYEYLWKKCGYVVTDKLFIRVQFRIRKGYWMNMNNPITMCEKLQWIKLHEHKPLYTILADKINAKIWLKERLGDSNIVKTYAIYDNVNEIDLSVLPEKFVIKCNHDSGTVFMCPSLSDNVFYDKHMNTYSFEAMKQKLAEGLKQNFFYQFREWCYKNIKPQILVEEYLECANGSIPNDYKLFFFNGKFEFIYVSFDRAGLDDRCIYDSHWKRIPFIMGDPNKYSNSADVPKPASFEKMIELGEQIAKEYRCVRIDFYDVDGKAYFGEITQFHSAGYIQFTPSKYDTIYGNKININNII